MFTLEQMKKWNYEKTWSFFSENAVGQYIPEARIYLEAAKQGPVYDLRRQKMPMNMMDYWAKEKTLFFIDGASASGKSTVARKLGERYGIEVVDIDQMCIKWVDAQLNNATPSKRYFILENFDKLTDEYILKNLEQEVVKASKGGKKSVILVGVFLEIIYRVIIGETIGAHFKNVVGIVLHESSFKKVISNDRAREEEFNFNESARDDKNLAYEYEYIEKIIREKLAWMLGTGTTISILTDKEAFND